LPGGSWATESCHGEQNLHTRFIRVSAAMFAEVVAYQIGSGRNHQMRLLE